MAHKDVFESLKSISVHYVLIQMQESSESSDNTVLTSDMWNKSSMRREM